MGTGVIVGIHCYNNRNRGNCWLTTITSDYIVATITLDTIVTFVIHLDKEWSESTVPLSHGCNRSNLLTIWTIYICVNKSAVFTIGWEAGLSPGLCSHTTQRRGHKPCLERDSNSLLQCLSVRLKWRGRCGLILVHTFLHNNSTSTEKRPFFQGIGTAYFYWQTGHMVATDAVSAPLTRHVGSLYINPN
jgi:hypothetical protein